MSWLFGIKNQQTPPTAGGDDGGDQQNQPAQPPLSKSERRAMEAYRFDSSALERAAEAAKTLERSSKSIYIFIDSFIRNLEKTRKAMH